jgi:hypothetical protein
MMKDLTEVKTRTLTPEEVEQLLLHDYGNKLQPVDSNKLAKLQRQQARYRDGKSMFSKKAPEQS